MKDREEEKVELIVRMDKNTAEQIKDKVLFPFSNIKEVLLYALIANLALNLTLVFILISII